jgi:hypothetical protein
MHARHAKSWFGRTAAGFVEPGAANAEKARGLCNALRLQLVDEPAALLSSRVNKPMPFLDGHITRKLTIFLLQLMNTLLLSRRRLAEAGLGWLLGLVLLHQSVDCGYAELHCLADV